MPEQTTTRARRLGFGALAGGCAAAALCAGFAPAAFAKSHATLGLSLGSSGHHTVSVSAVQGKKSVSLYVYKGHGTTSSSATYQTKGHVSAHSIKAKFGPYGKVSVRFHKTGSRSLKPGKGCHGKREVMLSGTFRGTIAFRGEHGYTKVRAHSAKGSVVPHPRDWKCKTKSSHKGFTSLSVGHQVGKNSVNLFVTHTHGARKASFDASESQTKHGISISRFVTAEGRGFKYSANLSSATVKAPRPFKGKGVYKVSGKPSGGFSSGTFGGNLSVSFLGDPHVRLKSASNASMYSAKSGG